MIAHEHECGSEGQLIDECESHGERLQVMISELWAKCRWMQEIMQPREQL